MLGRECSQESFCIEDFTRRRSAGVSHFPSKDALCCLDDEGSRDRVDIASRSDRAALFISLTNLYFDQKLLCRTTLSSTGVGSGVVGLCRSSSGARFMYA